MTTTHAVAMLSICLALAATGAAAQAAQVTPVDEEISAEEVLRLVDPDYPGLEAFATAMQAGEFERAQALLAEHFATRERPVAPEPSFPGIGGGNSMIVLQGSGANAATADEKWLKHVFTDRNNDRGTVETYDLGPEINWLHTPSPAFSWGLYLNQLNIVSKLAGVYRDTHDEKYATEIGNLLLSWTRQAPRGYGYTRDGRLVNSGMEVRNRLCNCIAAYDVVRAAPSFTPEMHMALWKLAVTACRELMTYAGVSYPGLIPAAVYFPEFSEAQQWLDAGIVDIRHQLVDRTTPEGAWDTHSISYQTVPVPWAARSLEFLQANSEGGRYDDLAAMIEEQAGKLLEMILRLTMPNGGLPNIGDTYGRSDWSSGAFLPSLSQWIALKLDEEQQARLEAIGDPFERLKAALAIAQGSETDEPARVSEGMPGAGYYLMRSGWEPSSARYLFFDLSAQAMGHAHNDATHFDLYAYGKPLLTDTGDYFLGWGYRTALHNAIEVDGQQQARGSAAPMMPREWLSTTGYDLVDGAHGAFAQQGVTQRRKIVFIKPDYFVLFDLLSGEGTHSYEQFFHFAGPEQALAAQVRLDPETLASETTHADTANVRVIPAGTEGLQAGFVEAVDTEMLPADKFERDAMLGWMVTTGTFRRVKSPTVVYSREGEARQAFIDVLFPTPEGADARVSVETLPVTQDGRTLDASSASGLVIHCEVNRPAHDPEEIVVDRGPNLALGCAGSAEVNSGSIAADAAGKLTDGEIGARSIPASVSSAPYQPGVALSGRFAVEFAEPAELNCVVLHTGTWNGSQILYPPEEMTVQVREGDAWRDVADPQVSWGEDFAAEVSFDPVTTSAVSVSVERPSGGRISMREFEAYRVSDAELARVAALRAERVTESWTDTLLISHEGGGERRYGEFAFDGEMALLRENEAGRITRLSVHRGSSLRRGDEVLLTADTLQDTLTRTWEDGTAPADAPGGPVVVKAPADAPPLTISDLRVQLRPPQEGLAGAQPWAEATWTTDRPATTQVEFRGPDGTVRRTILDRALTREHTARVEFLLPDAEYTFEAVSVDAEGRRAEARGGG